MHQLILASESPRRKKLLEDAGFSFHVFSVKVSEYLDKNLTLEDQISAIAKRKAQASLDQFKPSKGQAYFFLSADTMVIVDRIPFGKPENPEQAKEFLRLLSGRSHEVYTGVYLTEVEESKGRLKMRQETERLCKSTVHFRPLSNDEIDAYVETGEPMDKAGAYGIQGQGQHFITKIEGPYDNVVGLPMSAVTEMIKSFGGK